MVMGETKYFSYHNIIIKVVWVRRFVSVVKSLTFEVVHYENETESAL